MSNLEFEGKTTEEAINSAAIALNTAPELISFTIVTTGSRGFFGLGGRKARIRVNSFEPTGTAENNDQKKIKAQEDIEDSSDQKITEQTEINPSKQNQKPAKSMTDTLAESEPEKEIVFPPEVTPPPLSLPSSGESFVIGPPDPLMISASNHLKNIIDLMGFEAGIKASRIGNRIILTLDGPDNDKITGRKGAFLDSLQLLVYKMIRRDLNLGETGEFQIDCTRIVVDAGDYWTKRQEYLLELTRAQIKLVFKTGRPKSVPLLTPSERCFIQRVIDSVNGLTTIIKGKGTLRSILILPKDLPITKRPPSRHIHKPVKKS